MANDMSENELRTYEELYKNQGARIQFNCDSVTYQGIIDTILVEAQQIKLRHTKIVPGDHYMGMLRFRFSDISSFSVVESAEVVNRIPRNDYLLSILKKTRVAQNDSISKQLYGDRLSDESDNEDADDEKKEEEFSLDMPCHLRSKLPNDSTIIDTFDKDFELAIRHIFKQHVIGVSFSGPDISRFGKITWVCISTNACIFLFDIQTLQDEAFDRGLRDVFEDKTIKKVIHDCRFPSDCLAGKYSTQLTNVFDTQVADHVVFKQRYNDKYDFKCISSLDCCLRNYLEVPQEFLFQREKSLSSANKKVFLTKRPISNAFRYDLIRNALYLILLQETLAKELLAPLQKNVDAYSRVLAKASQEEIDSLEGELSSPDTIPPVLLMHGIQTAQFQKQEKAAITPLECKFIDPTTGTVVPLKSHATIQKPIHLKNVTACKNPSVMDKENQNNISNLRIPKQNYDGALKKAFRGSSCIEKNYNTDVKRISVKPSHRYIDEVFHKLANKVVPDQPVSVINVKPSDNYISKFSIRKPFSVSSLMNLDHSRKVMADGTDSNRTGLSENVRAENMSDWKQKISKNSIPWAALHPETVAKDPVLATGFTMNRKKFIPG